MTFSEFREILGNSLSASADQISLCCFDLSRGWEETKLSVIADNYFRDKKFFFFLPENRNLNDLKAGIRRATDQIIKFNATGRDYPFNGLLLAVEISLNEGVPRLLIHGKSADSNSKLSTQLPIFANSFADKLLLDTLQLVLDSERDPGDETSSLDVTIGLDPNKTIPGFNALFHVEEPLIINGPCWLENGSTQFYGIGAFTRFPEKKPELKVPGFTIELEQIGIVDKIRYSYITDQWFVFPFLVLDASMKIEGVYDPVYISVEIANPDADIHFEASNLDGLKNFAIDKLEGFLGLQASSISGITDKFNKAIGNIEVQKFGFYYNPNSADNKLRSVYGGVQFTNFNIPIINDIKIGITEFDFQLNANKRLDLKLIGKIELSPGEIKVELTSNDNGYGVAGYVNKEKPIDLSMLLEKFAGNQISIPKLVIDELKLELNCDKHSDKTKLSWLFDIDLQGHLPIPFNDPLFYINQVNFLFSYDGDKKYRFLLGGTLSIGAVDIYISSGYASDTKQWKFEGSTGTDQEIPLGRFIQEIWSSLQPANGDHKIPEAITSLVAENIDVSLEVKNGVAFEATAKISESKKINEENEVDGRDKITQPSLPTNHKEFNLDNISITLARRDSIKFSASATFSIEMPKGAEETITPKLNFDVNAAYNDGWDFNATMTSDGVTLAGIIETFAKGEEIPSSLKGFEFTKLFIAFNSSTGDKHFSGQGNFKIDKVTVTLFLKFDITHKDGKANDINFTGHIEIIPDPIKDDDKYVFDVLFKKESDIPTLVAAFHQENKTQSVSIGNLLASLGVTGAKDIPIVIKDAFFARDGQDKPVNLLVADVGSSLNLSNLPLVGKVLPTDSTLSVAVRILYASENYKESVERINKLLPAGISKISIATNGAKGIELISEIRIGDQIYNLELPIIPDADNGIKPTSQTVKAKGVNTAPQNVPSNTSIPVNDKVTWFNINKKFGPVGFNRVGLSYDKSLLNIYVDAGLNAGGLNFTLNGLSVSSPINEFKPTFNLDGLGLDMKKGALEIGASFIRRQVSDEKGSYDEFGGLALLKMEKFSIAALGSYAYYQGHPSLFIFAYLNQALGGPAFFFVEGLAVAFGYNRRLIMPEIDGVSKFPLVRQVMEGGDGYNNNNDRTALLSDQLQALSQYIPPSTGDMFLAVGVKFNSFKLIDSFAILAVSFGNHVEIDVIGQSNIVVPSEIPPGVPPLAEIKIQLLAKYLPEEGFLSVMAQLTQDSYIFSRNCHLTGGAAFYCWFKGDQQGDFVVTLGGYHPKFAKPDHYPSVPRLGLSWQVSNTLSVKGDMYFALCPHVFMAGGHLEALFNEGPLAAWFKAGIDFLISWQPYHYDMSTYLDIGASYTYQFFGTHHITVDVGADVHIWGPEFAGHATVHIWIFDVEVSFGSQQQPSAIPITWNDFQRRCLPEANKIISIDITGGKHNEGEGKVPIVNSKDLSIAINSAIPIKVFNIPGNPNGPVPFTSFSVAPMGAQHISVSEQTIRISREEKTNGFVELTADEITKKFNFNFAEQKLPSAIWGNEFKASLNKEEKIIRLVTGLTISTKPELKAAAVAYENRNAFVMEVGFEPSINKPVGRAATVSGKPIVTVDTEMLKSDLELPNLKVI